MPSFARGHRKARPRLEGRTADIILDTEQRPTKTPRAYCAPVRVPEEVYLVVPRVGGARTSPRSSTRPGTPSTTGTWNRPWRSSTATSATTRSPSRLPFCSSTSPRTRSGWRRRWGPTRTPIVDARAGGAAVLPAALRLKARLRAGAARAGCRSGRDARPLCEAVGHGHGGRMDAGRPGSTTSMRGFYVAAYLRAWALEDRWRAILRERFGERWFSEPAAGDWLQRLWRQGQRLRADELLRRSDVARSFDFEPLAARVRLSAQLLLDCGDDALAVVVSLLVVAHLAQLGRGQVGEAGLHLRRGQLVVGGDREVCADACSAAQPVGLSQGPVGGVADDAAGAAGAALDLAAGLAGSLGGALADRRRPTADFLASLGGEALEVLSIRRSACGRGGRGRRRASRRRLRVMRPRLTASSVTSWTRSRLRVRLRSRLERKLSTLLSRPVVGVLERLAELAVDFRAVLLRAVLFRAVVLRAVDFRAVLLRAVVFRAVVLRAVRKPCCSTFAPGSSSPPFRALLILVDWSQG